MGVGGFLGAVALAAAAASAQSTYKTTGADITYQFAIPEAGAAPFDVLVSITAPTAIAWAGFAAGGKMTRNPLLVAWPNGNSVVVSPRWTRYVLSFLEPSSICCLLYEDSC